VLTVLQATVAFASPLAACCPSRAASVQPDEECCPAGSHPPGQCPRHADSKRARAASCRLQCDAPHAGGFLVIAIGPLPSAAAVSTPVMDPQRLAYAAAVPILRSLVPDSPPPRLL
jgi:hypothetical protein